MTWPGRLWVLLVCEVLGIASGVVLYWFEDPARYHRCTDDGLLCLTDGVVRAPLWEFLLSGAALGLVVGVLLLMVLAALERLRSLRLGRDSRSHA